MKSAGILLVVCCGWSCVQRPIIAPPPEEITALPYSAEAVFQALTDLSAERGYRMTYYNPAAMTLATEWIALSRNELIRINAGVKKNIQGCFLLITLQQRLVDQEVPQDNDLSLAQKRQALVTAIAQRAKHNAEITPAR